MTATPGSPVQKPRSDSGPALGDAAALPSSLDAHAGLLERLSEAEQALASYLAVDSQLPPRIAQPQRLSRQEIELSVVMPCLNEADTLATCIRKARQAMNEHGIRGEIVIADNGSTDGSPQIAEQLGARVIDVPEKGYGHALRTGIRAARGRYVIMGDADDSYDFLEIPKFVAALREGHELVQGCRLPGGGGRVMPGAMPRSHRWLGNPLFSWLVRRMFKAPIHDVYCGLRGFTRSLFDRLDLQSPGMEFATEMIIKSSLFGVDIVETPTTLYPDGRTSHPPHLRTVRDGWRTLRFFLMYSPEWLFLAPGVGLFLLGLLGYACALPGVRLMGATLDAHTLLVASLAMLIGSQAIQFAIFAKTYAISRGLVPEGPRMARVRRAFSLELGLVVGVTALVGGGGLILDAVNQWRQVHFGALDYATTMRRVIPGVTLAALGFQTVLASFLLSILRMAQK